MYALSPGLVASRPDPLDHAATSFCGQATRGEELKKACGARLWAVKHALSRHTMSFDCGTVISTHMSNDARQRAACQCALAHVHELCKCAHNAQSATMSAGLVRGAVLHGDRDGGGAHRAWWCNP